MANSTYKPWLRNLYVRRLFIIFVVPVALPVMMVYLLIKSTSEWFPEVVKAWQPEHLNEPS
jgi:hypothetical protein